MYNIVELTRITVNYYRFKQSLYLFEKFLFCPTNNDNPLMVPLIVNITFNICDF